MSTIARAVFICLLTILIFAPGKIQAQIPVINSFSPQSGPAGTVVSITGSNFSAIPVNNTVYFGAAKGEVLSASAGMLSVKAPAGTSYLPITITTNLLTAYSNNPFNLTFKNPPITSASFAAKVDYPASTVSNVIIKDLNGDGKSDIVSVSGALLIFQNNSTPGTLSFATPISKSYNDYSVGLAVDDLDGDTRPDIIVSNLNAHTITIYKNISTASQIDFESGVVMPLNIVPYKIAIADFNGDGKPDLAITDQNSSPAVVGVYTNTTAANGAISFAPATQLPSFFATRGITIRDIDLDNKPDIIVASQSGYMSIFRNSTTGANITFAAKKDYAITGSLEGTCIADFDADGKPDIAVADNNVPGTISVLKNNSTPGVISLSPMQNYVVGTNPYGITAADINGDGKPDIAVTNQVTNNISILINSSSAGSINFNPKIDFPTGNFPRSIDVADLDGDSKADIIVGNNESGSIAMLLANSVKSPSIITFPTPAEISVGGNNTVLTGATSTNTETAITYTSSNPAVATIDADGVVHVISPGTTDITAQQAGNENYTAAVPVSRTFTVKQNQSVQIQPISKKITCDADFSVQATSTNPAIPLVYVSSNTLVATINAQGIIHIIAAGTTSVTVTQPGNDLYIAAEAKTAQLVVETPVSPVVSISPDFGISCAGTPLKFTAKITNAVGTANYSYQWKINGVNSGSNQNTLTVANAGKTDAFTCIVTNNDACLVQGTSNTLTGLNIVNYTTPGIAIKSSTNIPVCAGTSVTFTADVVNEGTNPTYQWKVNNLDVGTNKNTFETTTLNNGDLVTCMLINNGGLCLTQLSAVSNTITAAIIPPAVPAPSVKVTGSINNIYAGTPITFTAVPADAGMVINYQWLLNGASTGAGGNTFTSSDLRNNDEVVCVVTGNLPCTAPVKSNPVKITVLPPLVIKPPSTFTPNGDGINDTWNIPELTSYTDCVVRVFNRSGILLYQSKNYKAWDGTYKGQPLPVATYYYIIELGSNGQKLKGPITIIR